MRRLNLLASVGIITFLSLSTANAATCASEDGGGALNGQCSSAPAKFIQTINAMRLARLNDDNSITFVEMGTTPQAFDFASVTAGADIGNYISGIAIPDGTYVAVSPILDEMATVSGDVTVDGMYCRSTPAGANAVAGTVGDYTYDYLTGSPHVSGSDAAYDYGTAGATEQYINGDGDLVIVQKVTPFTITTGVESNVLIEVRFNADQAMDFSFNGSECTEVHLGALDGQFITTVN